MIKGVNLGNWLVLEKWMSPELFDGTTAEDETYLCQQLSETAKKERLKVHRDSYITPRDFAYLAEKGIDVLRIPVPFFIFGDYPPYVGCIEYLDKAFEWAEKYGLRILIDLHTVPDSQNGFDNGGICGVCRWHKNPAYVEFALSVLERLAARYKDHPCLWGIEPLNEPISRALWDIIDLPKRYPAVDQEAGRDSEPVPTEFLQQFYRDAYHRIRAVSEKVTVVFQDGFRAREWVGFFKEPEFQNFYLDIHLYLMGQPDSGAPVDLAPYLRHIQVEFAGLVDEMAVHFPVVIGEWCIDTPSNKLKSLSIPQKRPFYQQISAAELAAWRSAAGWFFWSYKLHTDTPATDGWDMGKAMELGYFPKKF
jgi:glucan 1,3-beta-glucosidase